jgi:flavoprotein
MNKKSFTFELTDNEGKHILKANRDCVWKCKDCKTEVEVTEESIINIRDKKLLKCPKCGCDCKLHYWLDCQD